MAIATEATAVINVHREGPLLVPTLRSLVHAKRRAWDEGFRVLFDIVADRPDAATMAVLSRFEAEIDSVEQVDYGNLSLSRHHGIENARTELVFLHDGDDLYSSNWYAAVLREARAGRFDRRSVYHTALFARFGDVNDLAMIPDSGSITFDPFTLLLDWYFSNKCAFHRGLVEDYPIPPIDKSRGVGNEDWSWSADTIAHGVRHLPVPDTVCYYRVKPHHLSLGAAKGVMQSPSPLFSADYMEAEAAERSTRPLVDLPPESALELPAFAQRPAVPLGASFMSELAVQEKFEPLLSRYHALGFGADTTVAEKPQYPGAARLYRAVQRFIGSGNLVVVFLPEKLPYARDHLLEWVRAAHAIASRGETKLLVVFDTLDRPDLVLDLPRWNGVGLNVAAVDAAGIYEPYQKARFLMRFLLQNRVVCAVDFGARTAGLLTTEFPAAYSSFVAVHVAAFPQRRLDWFDAAIANALGTARAVAAERGRPTPAVAFFGQFLAEFEDPLVRVLHDEALLGREADAFSAARLGAGFERQAPQPEFRTDGPVRLASLLREAIAFGARRQGAGRAPQARRRAKLVSVRLPGGAELVLQRSADAIVNQTFRDLSGALLEEHGWARIAIPGNIVMRLADHDRAVWLDPRDAALSIARFLDVVVCNRQAHLPFAAMLRPSDVELIGSLSGTTTARSFYRKLALDFAERVIIVPRTTVASRAGGLS